MPYDRIINTILKPRALSESQLNSINIYSRKDLQEIHAIGAYIKLKNCTFVLCMH